jgi:hypothetical protein
MSLGNDNTVCTDEFVAAMRSRLDTEDPPLGGNVDEPGIRKNFAALGEAVFQILLARTETSSTSIEDAEFWTWVGRVTTFLTALAAWQQGVRSAVQNWAPVDPPGQQLRTAILAVPQPGAAPGPAPVELTGRLR